MKTLEKVDSSQKEKKNPIQSILNITERKKAKDRQDLETKRGIKQKLKGHLDNIGLKSRKKTRVK